MINYETYENRNNPHITIHKSDCGQLRKHGGDHKYSQGEYHGFTDIKAAEAYANTTDLPVKKCKFCIGQKIHD